MSNNENNLELRPNGEVVRLDDDKVIARVRDVGGTEEIQYAHHAFARYAEAITELLEAGPTEAIEEPEAAPEPEPELEAPRAWEKGDPAPAQHPHLGDQTPAYIEWAKVCMDPVDFRRRYQNGLRLTRYEAQRAKQRRQQA